MLKQLNKIIAVFAVNALLLSTAALAAGTAVLNMDNEEVKLAWLDSKNVRMDNDDHNYVIINEDSFFMVDTSGSQAEVIKFRLSDIQSMVDMVSAFGDQDEPLPSIEKIKATGKSETIAGIKGEIYEVTAKEGTDEGIIEVVLTNNDTVVELTNIYLHVIQNMFGEKTASEFFDALPSKNRGLLRIDTSVIVSINDNKPSADLFDLPAEPMDLGSLLKQFQ